MKLLLSHIADPDGITPIILLNLLNENFEYKLFEANNLSEFILENLDSDYFDKYDQIYIVDLGISKECANLIVNSKYKDKFKLFDHHETNYHLNDYDFAEVIEEVDGFKECGTSLFFNYLVKTFENPILTKPSVVNFVELVRENDTWQFTELEQDAHNLSALFSFYGREAYVDTYTEFLKNNNRFYFNKTELLILKSLNRQKQEYLEEKKDKVIIRKIDGYNVGIVFAERYRSNLGNYLAKVYKDEVDFICIINLARHISLRGIKDDKPVNKFAEIYGGGGHPLASAMPNPEGLKEKIIDYIFGEISENK
jgi:oligoribonuclease NrnB/cAMP/cGMP phosphodiesterase (DHH superfamily)